MTETDWLTAEHPGKMLWHVETFSERKFRLVACACCRGIWTLLTEERSRIAVQAAEDLADSIISRDTASEILYSGVIPDETPKGSNQYSVARSALIQNVQVVRAVPALVSGFIGDSFELRNPYDKIHCTFLRDIFGNPFRPVTLDPAWLTPTVVALANSIYADRAFDRMPILADALEEAGCDNADVLLHCRGDGPHVKGCWVDDLVLGKE